MNTQLWLCLTIAVSGMWSGLLLTVTTILHPMFRSPDAAGFAGDLHRFLPIARRSPTNYVLVIALVIAPALAVGSLWADGGAALALTAIGASLTLVGAVLVSRFAAEPNYEVILGWDPTDPPQSWRITRRRYFALNWIRGALVWTAFGCFLAAAYLHWS